MSRERLAIRNYVSQPNIAQAIHPDTVVVDMTHSNLVQCHVEIRLSKSDRLDSLRQKIYQQTGTPHSFQHLQIFDSAHNVLFEIPPSSPTNHYPIGYYLDRHGLRVHCIDTNPYSLSKHGGLEDVSKIKKFTLTDEQYEQRPHTLRKYKQAQPDGFTFHRDLALKRAQNLHRQGQPLPKGYVLSEDGSTVVEDETRREYGPESVQHCTIGGRCEILGGRRGTIQWVGETPGAGYFVGIRLDEPTGKNNGVLFGTRYFAVPDQHGAFVRGDTVQVGDYPERDVLDSSEDEL